MIGQFIRRVTGQSGTLTLDDPTGWRSSDRPLFGGKEMQAMKLPAVNACIEIISDSIAKMPVYLMDSGTRERVTDHPALRLLTGRPTEALTAFDYHKLMESRRIAYGNAYALILRDKWGVPVELLPIEGIAVEAEKLETEDEPDEGEAKKLTRAAVLEKARACVCGEREEDYGSPEDSFGCIAELWEAYLRAACIAPNAVVTVTPTDVAMMMALLKIARVGTSFVGGTADSFVDLAGYAACGAECAEVTV